MNVSIYDNFNIGVMTPPQGQDDIGIAFTEKDFEDERFNTVHVFKIHKDTVDKVIAMLQDAKSKTTGVVMPTPQDLANLRNQ